MSRFSSEAEKSEFKDLCVEILLSIRNIEQALKKYGVTKGGTIRIGSGGYLALDVYEGKWNMARYKEDGPVKICYEYSEEISVPEGKGFDKVSENLVEISMTFAKLQPEIKDKQDIDSTTWKQKFVDWANEFERMYENADWGTEETDGRDYIDVIEEYAKKKIRQFAGLEE